MIRPFTLITMLLAAVSGAYLFVVKHHAQMLDDQIAHISQQSRLDAGRITVLQAQWALETDPTRLQQLATQFTHLQPMQPAQLVTLAALRTSLPAPGSAPPGLNPELPGAAQPDVASELDAANAQPGTPAGLPLPPPQAPSAAPVETASALAVPKPLVIRATRRVNRSVLAATQLAEVLPPPRPYEAPRPLAASSAPYEPAASSLPMGAQVMSVKASVSVPQYTPPPVTPPVSADDSGSVLGMAANLPPPQPLPQSGMAN